MDRGQVVLFWGGEAVFRLTAYSIPCDRKQNKNIIITLQVITFQLSSPKMNLSGEDFIRYQFNQVVASFEDYEQKSNANRESGISDEDMKLAVNKLQNNLYTYLFHQYRYLKKAPLDQIDTVVIKERLEYCRNLIENKVTLKPYLWSVPEKSIEDLLVKCEQKVGVDAGSRNMSYQQDLKPCPQCHKPRKP